MWGIPAIGWINVSILSPLYAWQNQRASPFTGKSSPRKTAATLKILSVSWVVGICLSSDLDMAFNHGTTERVQANYFAFASVGSFASEEPKPSPGAKVFRLQPPVGFVRVRSLGPIVAVDNR